MGLSGLLAAPFFVTGLNMPRTRRILLAMLGLLAIGINPTFAGAAGFDHSHEQFTALLSRHVHWNAAGTATTVDYGALAQERAALESYSRALSAVSLAEFRSWPQPERMSFLINAYNAFTLQRILSRYPNLRSIRDLGNIVFDSPWKQRFFQLLGASRHLDEVEHELLRGAADFNEPRIHFAVNCASVGCPALRPEAYRADRLVAQLDDQTRRFLRDRSRNRFEPAGSGTAWISPIFKWYGEDFEQGHQGYDSLRGFLASYAEALAATPPAREQLRRGSFAVKYTDYSWDLNDAPRHKGSKP